MKIIKRIFAPKEAKVTLNVLDELSLEFKTTIEKGIEKGEDGFILSSLTQAFELIRRQVEEGILGDYKNVVSQVKDRASARQLIYFSIANIAGDYVESGHYHIYRGVLTPLGDGLLSLFNMATDRLLEDGAISKKEAKEQKTGIRKNIKCVG